MNFALVLGILIWDMFDCSGCNFLYFVKVGFDLESLSMCMYAYLLYLISQYWVRLRYLSGLESSSGSGLHSYFSFGYIGNL